MTGKRARVNPFPPPPEIYLPDGSVNLFNSGNYYDQLDLKYWVTKAENNYICRVCMNRCGNINVNFTFDFKTNRPVEFEYKNLCFLRGTVITICKSGDMKNPVKLYFGLRRPEDSFIRLTFKRQNRYVIGIFSNLRCRTDLRIQAVKRRTKFANSDVEHSTISM